MAQTRFELVFLDGKRAGESVPLDGAEVTIGRSRSNTILLEDPLVSRHHLRLAMSGAAVMMHDLDSSHGTFLNNKRVRGSVSLNPGDVIQVGDVKLRFSAPENTDAEKTAFVDVDASDASKSSATHFAQASSAGALSETGFMAAPEPPPEDPDDKTRVFADGETRLLDDRELKGLRAAVAAAPAPPRKNRRILIATLATLSVVTAVGLLTRSPGTAEKSGAAGLAKYSDQEYGFSMMYPEGWRRATNPGGALIRFESRDQAAVAVFADKNPAYTTEGIQTGFETYSDAIAGRHEGMTLDGAKPTRVNDARVVYYGFSSPSERGKGLFLFSGNRRMCIEFCAPRAQFDALSAQFSDLLNRFRLFADQQCIDFPPAAPATRRAALANPVQIEQSARSQFDVGSELLKNRNVRTENLYLSVQTIRNSLTTASALTTRPAFYADAARALAEAETALANAVRDQKLQIVLAERRNNREAAYWEAVKLMQVIPDKNNENYQYAVSCVRKYGKKQGD